MLELSIVDGIRKFFNQIGDFIKDHYSEPFFWIAIFLVLLVLAVYVISELGDK